MRDRLTPKEMRIVALIVQGCKNREIAQRLKTTEQVIKNYLRSIYDKTGVGDRLELALFTIHHRVLARAAAEVGNKMEAEARDASGARGIRAGGRPSGCSNQAESKNHQHDQADDCVQAIALKSKTHQRHATRATGVAISSSNPTE